MKITIEIEVEADTGTYDALNAIWLRAPGKPDIDITDYLPVDDYEKIQHEVECAVHDKATRKAESRDIRGDIAREIQQEELASRAAQRRIGA